MSIINVADILEKNGKTIRENNLNINHKIPLGTLVEIISWDEESSLCYGGLRLFVVHHQRDCDGTPLYGLSWDIEAVNYANKQVSDIKDPVDRFIFHVEKAKILNGFSEESLKIIK